MKQQYYGYLGQSGCIVPGPKIKKVRCRCPKIKKSPQATKFKSGAVAPKSKEVNLNLGIVIPIVCVRTWEMWVVNLSLRCNLMTALSNYMFQPVMAIVLGET